MRTEQQKAMRQAKRIKTSGNKKRSIRALFKRLRQVIGEA